MGNNSQATMTSENAESNVKFETIKKSTKSTLEIFTNITESQEAYIKYVK